MFSDPFITASCDGDGCMETHEMHENPEPRLERELLDIGWIVESGRHFCSVACAESTEVQP